MKQETKKERPAVYPLNRREMLMLLGGTTALSLFGCGGPPGGPFDNTPYSKQSIAGCIVSPGQTEGPYFVDEKLNRSDIRTDPSDNSVRPGIPLHLAITIFQVGNNACQPLPNATIDIWHCDAAGAYSDVKDNAGNAGDTRGKKFLRGYQVTDANGKVEFQTIYPGWYTGRPVHIHYMIRTNPASEVGHEFTSQLYFDETVTDQVHAQPPYSQKGKRDMTLANDFIYRRGGSELMVQLTPSAEGYSGIYNVGFLIT